MYQKPLTKTVWIVGLVFVVSITVGLYAASEEYGQSTGQQESQQQQQHTRQGMQKRMQEHQEQWAQSGTSNMQMTGMLCSAEKLMGSDVKSSAMSMSRQQGSMTDQEQSGSMSERETALPRDVEQRKGTTSYKQGSTDSGYGTGGQHETLGTVEELIINDNQNDVCYVILNSGGQYYPVPWQAFDFKTGEKMQQGRQMTDQNMMQTDQDMQAMSRHGRNMARQEPTLYLNISRDQLRQAPSISSVSIERLSDSQLKQKIDSFYSQHTGKQISSPQMRQSQMQQRRQMGEQAGQEAQAGRSEQTATAQMKLMKASDVIGLDLQSTSDADLGSIEDLIIDARAGQIAYGLVSFGGFLNVGEKTAAVPWSSLNIDMQQQYARIDATREKLEAAVVDPDTAIAQLSRPDTARRFYENFNAEPYWVVYGFIPGQTGAASLSAWQPYSTYNQKFEPDKITSVKGTIQSVSTFQPESGAASGVQLKVRTDEGQTMTVHVGPQQFIRQKGMNFSSGQDIKVTGSKVTIDGESVIMASELTANDQTLNLRDSQGRPQWNLQGSGQQMQHQRESMQDRQRSRQQQQESMQDQQQDQETY